MWFAKNCYLSSATRRPPSCPHTTSITVTLGLSTKEAEIEHRPVTLFVSVLEGAKEKTLKELG